MLIILFDCTERTFLVFITIWLNQILCRSVQTAHNIVTPPPLTPAPSTQGSLLCGSLQHFQDAVFQCLAYLSEVGSEFAGLSGRTRGSGWAGAAGDLASHTLETARGHRLDSSSTGILLS